MSYSVKTELTIAEALLHIVGDTIRRRGPPREVDYWEYGFIGWLVETVMLLLLGALLTIGYFRSPPLPGWFSCRTRPEIGMLGG